MKGARYEISRLKQIILNIENLPWPTWPNGMRKGRQTA